VIEQSSHPIQVVAQETGFVDPRRMREAFLRTFGLPPQTFAVTLAKRRLK
jgi:transcriptional regulator GlxA family with amidase domain